MIAASNVENIVLDTLVETTRYPREILTPEAQFDEDLGIDSLKRVEIVAALLNRFGQAPSDLKELGPLPRTVGELTHFAVEYVSKLSGIDPPASDGKHATEMVRGTPERAPDAVNRLGNGADPQSPAG